MISITLGDLDKLILDSLCASKYAEENYVQLKNRQSFYTLYGGKSTGIGAASPSHLTTNRERQLSRAPRGKIYTCYELDRCFQILCNKLVDNKGSVICSYYHFEINGIRYARDFLGDSNIFYTDIIHCLKTEANRPVFYAQISPSMVYAEYYDASSFGFFGDKTTSVTSYLYYPKRMFTTEGLPICRDAPFGAPESPVTVCYYKRILPNITFEPWFKD